jgi:hypothetical protein
VGSTWTLFRQDPNTGVTTPFASITNPAGGEYLSAFDPSTRRFFTYVNTSGNNYSLFAVNVDTGAVSSPVAIGLYWTSFSLFRRRPLLRHQRQQPSRSRSSAVSFVGSLGDGPQVKLPGLSEDVWFSRCLGQHFGDELPLQLPVAVI